MTTKKIDWVALYGVLVLAAVFATAAHWWPTETFAFMGSVAVGKMK